MKSGIISKVKESLNSRNTLFNKAILIFIAVSFTAFLLTGILLSRFMVSYAVDDNVKQMVQTASLIDAFIDSTIESKNISADKKYAIEEDEDNFRSFAYLNGDITSSHIYIVEMSENEDRGRIVVSTTKINDDIKENIIKNEDGEYFFKEEQYKAVLESDKTIIDDGDYYGLYKNSEISWVTIAQKLESFDSDGNKILVGIIVISRPMGNVDIIRQTVIRYFLLAMCIALLLSIIIAAFFTKKITEPIEKLRLAANKVSKGDFRGKIEYDSQDDMGDLITSFNAMTRSLENQDTAKNDFISNVSHELRTPLTTIGGFIDGMTDGTIPEEKHEYYLKIVKDEVLRINNLVNDQLQIARLQHGVMDFKPQTFDINEMIRLEIIKNEKVIDDKRIEIEVEFENDKQSVFAEPQSINRVIINLLNNAIKFTPESGKITIGTKKKKNKVEIYVKDTGIGIAPDEIERVFERYFKSDRSRGVDKTGTGIGLSICRDIVKAHGHVIKAENNADGHGTRFVFWLDVG